MKLTTRNNLISEINLPYKSVGVELGVFAGEYSEVLWSSGRFSKLYLVDIFTGSMYSGDKDGANGRVVNLDDEYARLKSIYAITPYIEVVQSKSVDFINSLPHATLDFAYIDADHSYDAVKQDLEALRSKVKPGGFICGHDYNAATFPGIPRAVSEFAGKYGLSMSLTTEDMLASYVLVNICNNNLV